MSNVLERDLKLDNKRKEISFVASSFRRIWRNLTGICGTKLRVEAKFEIQRDADNSLWHSASENIYELIVNLLWQDVNCRCLDDKANECF